jgi:hypothetical protein
LIDQTKYGVAADRKSKHEPGASVLISHEFKPVKTITVKNRLQLFTNYIHNPQNIDVDWEMIFVASLNWFTDIRLNTHLIFDDDTKTLLYTRNRDPVLGPDGLQKKQPGFSSRSSSVYHWFSGSDYFPVDSLLKSQEALLSFLHLSPVPIVEPSQ